MMKHLSLFYTMVVSFFSMFASVSFAQSLPTDGDFPLIGPGGNPGTWAGDTIIIIPITDPASGMLSLNQAPRVFAIYKDDILAICSEKSIYFTYELNNISDNIYISSSVSVAPSLPWVFDLSSFPAGRYSLLFYINNECLEGVFEKE